MTIGRELMTDWVVESLKHFGGRASIFEISRFVWGKHEQEIRADDNLLYKWQYELRWAGDILRKEGVLRKAKGLPRGVWELS